MVGEMDELVIAQFDKSEIKVGNLLGSGGFSNVYAICHFHLRAEASATHQNDFQARIYPPASTRAKRTAVAGKRDRKYAIKVPKQQVGPKDPKFVEETLEHFHNEVRTLRSVNHPNILKIRGLAISNDLDCYCIVFDRLEENLDDRILRWGHRSKRLNNSYRRVCDRKRDKRHEFFVERLTVAVGIARALAYLHDENMIYRDLKPANIGFDEDNRVILFDMGLCREMPEKGLDDKFEMSGKGTVRYMSPEVRRRQRYNEKADVYSFAHVLWEILALEKPYAGYTCEMHAKRVVKQGQRPPLNDSWPARICNLLELGWDADPQRRFSMIEVQQTLEEVLSSISKPDSRHNPIKRIVPSIVPIRVS